MVAGDVQPRRAVGGGRVGEREGGAVEHGDGGVEGVLEGHESAVSCCAWDPADGKLASADKKGNLMIWV